MVNFFLLDEQRSRTPKGEEEMELMLAGLGKRSLTVTEDATHSKEQLDVTPLPPDAKEFRDMRKAACGKSGLMIPLQGLPSHINNCTIDVDLCSVSEEENKSVEHDSPDSPDNQTEMTAECPMCGIAFPTHTIEAHAADCGDATSSTERSSDLVHTFTTGVNTVQKSAEDVLQFLADRVDAGKEFRLCIDRQNLLESTQDQWQRKKTASPVNILKVVFLGEAGMDTGA
ncbi:uncharacterized protein PAE49_015967 [Odontesthes bonariensis]